MTYWKSNFDDDVEEFTTALYGGFKRKHFWTCFDCVINEFPFWWHFPDLACFVRALPLLPISIYRCFHSRFQIGYRLCGFVILVVFKTNICSCSMFWMISNWKISQNLVKAQMVLFINKLGMGICSELCCSQTIELKFVYVVQLIVKCKHTWAACSSVCCLLSFDAITGQITLRTNL
jgi:hypothetical protein